MRLALDPYMFRTVPLVTLPSLVASLGYEYIELSPRDDVLPFLVHPRATGASIGEFRRALADAHVSVASVLPLYRWSSPDEDERQAAVRYWKRAIEVAVDLGCDTMNSELSGRPEDPLASEAQFWRSMEALLPNFEREGVKLHLEAHPDDFIETNTAGVDLVRAIGSPDVSYIYCAPHTFHLGQDVGEMIRYAGSTLSHVHLADSLSHVAGSGLRFIVNPAGSPVRVHQHLDIGQGEVDFEALFAGLREIGFDGLLTSSVFAWEDRAEESARSMLATVTDLLRRHPVTMPP